MNTYIYKQSSVCGLRNNYTLVYLNILVTSSSGENLSRLATSCLGSIVYSEK